jgi:hypothetical protein
MNTLLNEFDLWVKKSYWVTSHFNLESKLNILNYRHTLIKNILGGGGGGVQIPPWVLGTLICETVKLEAWEIFIWTSS